MGTCPVLCHLASVYLFSCINRCLYMGPYVPLGICVFIIPCKWVPVYGYLRVFFVPHLYHLYLCGFVLLAAYLISTLVPRYCVFSPLPSFPVHHAPCTSVICFKVLSCTTCYLVFKTSLRMPNIPISRFFAILEF